MNQNMSTRYLQRDTDKIMNWTTKWKVKINSEKCQTSTLVTNKHYPAYKLKYFTSNSNGNLLQNTYTTEELHD